MADRERYRLVIESKPSRAPAANRLRQLLKIMLRRFGFRCVTIRRERSENE